MKDQESEQTCVGCVHYIPKVDMGWTHADVTDLCGLTRAREPRPGIKGCVRDDNRPAGSREASCRGME